MILSFAIICRWRPHVVMTFFHVRTIAKLARSIDLLADQKSSSRRIRIGAVISRTAPKPSQGSLPPVDAYCSIFITSDSHVSHLPNPNFGEISYSLSEKKSRWLFG